MMLSGKKILYRDLKPERSLTLQSDPDHKPNEFC